MLARSHLSSSFIHYEFEPKRTVNLLFSKETKNGEYYFNHKNKFGIANQEFIRGKSISFTWDLHNSVKELIFEIIYKNKF